MLEDITQVGNISFCHTVHADITIMDNIGIISAEKNITFLDAIASDLRYWLYAMNYIPCKTYGVRKHFGIFGACTLMI